MTIEEELSSMDTRAIDAGFMARALDITLRLDSEEYSDLDESDQLALYSHINTRIYNSICNKLKLKINDIDVGYREYIPVIQAFNESYTELTQHIGKVSPAFEFLAVLNATADLFSNGKLDYSGKYYDANSLVLGCLRDRNSNSSIKEQLADTHRLMYIKFMDSVILKSTLTKNVDFQTAFLYLEKKITKYEQLNQQEKEQLVLNCYKVSTNYNPAYTRNNLELFKGLNSEFDSIVKGLQTLLDLGSALEDCVVISMVKDEPNHVVMEDKITFY